MTSEVVVMNSLAVALAADSAATVTAGSENKIYNSADKLFMLSKHYPVGVMIYNNASFLGVPWETILKMFRRELRDREYPKLADYGNRLMEFLAKSPTLFPHELQDHFYVKLVEGTFRRIAAAIGDELFLEFIRNDKRPTAEEQLVVAKRHIYNERALWQKRGDVECYAAGLGETMAGRFSKEVNDARMKLFDQDLVALDGDASAALRELAILLLSKADIAHEIMTGVVIAGFGADEHLPVMQSFELGGIYEGNLKYRRLMLEAIGLQRQSLVVPFAHADMVNTFLHGMNPSFERLLIREVISLARNLPSDIIDTITDLSDEQKKVWKAKMDPVGIEAGERFLTDITEYRVQQHREPILQAIAHLPKDQLAHVAASLVNLNSFQKRMSMKPETVGGPIDVAVISKGDGFIWIERKHYFKPELNHHFFKNYYPSDARIHGERNDGPPQEKAGSDSPDPGNSG